MNQRRLRTRFVVATLQLAAPASFLALSVPTVNAHLQAIYRKAGVSGREQLLGSLG